jgi:hypothetical protein
VLNWKGRSKRRRPGGVIWSVPFHLFRLTYIVVSLLLGFFPEQQLLREWIWL